MDSSSSTTPRLCARGCGFFGTAENRDMCSKCHTLYLKELVAKSEAEIIGDDDQWGGSFRSMVEGMMNELEVDKLADALKSTTLTSDDHNNNDDSSPVRVAKKRCGLCRKRVGLVGFDCRCGATFCGTHRYPEAHSCEFDYKSAGKTAIRDENPVCKSDKIRDRV